MNEDIFAPYVKKYGTPLMVTDCNSIREQYNRLNKALPNVKIYYALKPFPHVNIINVLDALNSNFDIATNGEVDLVKKAGISPDRCIHTHPIKKIEDIKHALKFGITSFVVDNEDELLKFKKFNKKVKLMLRICFRSSSASIDLSKKFGCDPSHVISMIELARKHKIRINAFSFHVGSQNQNSDAYVLAIHKCKDLIAQTILRGLPEIEILDIGGGFPISYEDEVISIEDFCKPITDALMVLPDHVKVYCEPGRFIVGPSTTNLSSVVGKAIRGQTYWYYLDDGNYFSYSAQFFDSVKIPMFTTKDDHEKFNSVLAGPTCDSIDVIKENIMLPKLEIGDIITGKTMGAYSWATSTNFNFCKLPKQIFINL